jgi:hypothetical protein
MFGSCKFSISGLGMERKLRGPRRASAGPGGAANSSNLRGGMYIPNVDDTVKRQIMDALKVRNQGENIIGLCGAG